MLDSLAGLFACDASNDVLDADSNAFNIWLRPQAPQLSDTTSPTLASSYPSFPKAPATPLDSSLPLSITDLTGVPLKQMPHASATANRLGSSLSTPSRRGGPIAYAVVAPGSPGIVQSNPAVPPPKNPKLYKTELCRSWMDQGRCNYGDRCQYAHGEHEKRSVPRHPKYKTEMCQSYHKSGYCPYGMRCHFIHSESEVQPHPTARDSGLRAALSAASSLPLRPDASSFHSLLARPVLPSLTAGGYGSSGESPSSSNADSGSESPAGSFSPGLDLDDACLSPFAAVLGLTSAQSPRSAFSAFGAPSVLQPAGSQPSHFLASRYNSTAFSDSLLSSSPSKSDDEHMGALLEDIVAWSVDERPEKHPVHSTPSSGSRLPVFAQLSNPPQ